VEGATGLECLLLPRSPAHHGTQLYDHDYKTEEAAKVLGDTVPTVEATYGHVFEPRSRSTW
jgi:hypothetical protein